MRQTERIVQNIIKIIDLRKKTWKILQKVVSLPQKIYKKVSMTILLGLLFHTMGTQIV